MRLHVEQAQFEHGEQAARARADNQHIGFDRFAHVASFRLNLPGRRPAGSRLGCACLAKTAVEESHKWAAGVRRNPLPEFANSAVTA